MLDVPPAVIEMLARYRDLQRTQGYGWGTVESSAGNNERQPVVGR